MRIDTISSSITLQSLAPFHPPPLISHTITACSEMSMQRQGDWNILPYVPYIPSFSFFGPSLYIVSPYMYMYFPNPLLPFALPMSLSFSLSLSPSHLSTSQTYNACSEMSLSEGKVMRGAVLQLEARYKGHNLSFMIAPSTRTHINTYVVDSVKEHKKER